MWNKMTLRIKITVLTAISLTAMCVCLTAISIHNTNIFYEPITYIADKQPINVIVSESVGLQNIDNIDEIKVIDGIFLGSREIFKTQSIVSAVVIIVIGTVISYFIAGQTLKPLNILTERIEEIDENSLNAQIIPTSSGSEVARLTKSFNNMLEKLDKAFFAKKLFASNAAHELKTPLANILTTIEVMQMDDKPGADEYEEVIEITKENVDRLTVIVQDLLRFNADLDDGLCERMQTGELFNKIVVDLSKIIEEKNISVTINGNIEIYGEKTLLERAFYNLVLNAVKYNRDNGEIRITATRDEVIIEDTGIGIPKENIPQIFDPFYCVDKSRSRRLGGNGLGLSIAKQIFDKHNMAITISSDENKGTTVFINVFNK